MRPLGNFGLKRRMNEIERALTITILFLIVFVIFLSFFWAERDFELDRRKDVLLQQLAAAQTSQFDPKPIFKTESINRISSNDEDRGERDSDSSYFLPGSIENMNRTEVLHRCYVPSSFRLPVGQGCSVSQKYKIIFHLTPKSGSSTGRHVIKADFEGQDHMTERNCRSPPDEKSEWREVAVLRNPATRAFAAYEEMFVRRLGNPEAIPSKARSFMEPFRGWKYPNYSALFDTVEGVAKLNAAYEQFMRDWDGYAFDMHLESQVAYNMRASHGKDRHTSDHLSFVFDTHTMEDSFEQLAKMVHLQKKPKVIRGRAYPRRLNVSHVSDEAFQAMCRIYKEDFCCLNYKLPPQCLRNVPPRKRTRCRWVEHKGERLIEAVVV